MNARTASIVTMVRPPRLERARGQRSLQQAAIDSRWLMFLCLTLLGYALAGKGAAYIGLPPFLYVGEMLMLSGIAIVVCFGRFDGILNSPSFLLLGALMAWGFVCTVPYVSTYGADALRDAVIWGYAVFAFILYGYLLANPIRLAVLIERYRRYFVPIFLVLIPGLWWACRHFDAVIPTWPWADGAPVISAKGGDVLAHLAGIVAFWASGLAGRVKLRWIVLLTAFLGTVGAYNRGGLITAIVVFAFCFMLRPSQPVLRRMMVVGACGLLALAITGFSVSIPTSKERELSFEQVTSNVISVMFDAGNDGLKGTKEWRLNWWTDIWNYTVNGPYRWGGKGFGINLADDDGYQGTAWEGKLRSPHNGHMTFLARSGVPGFALWILVQVTWARLVLLAMIRSAINGDQRWSAAFMFIFGYWLAFMCNTSFDVFLEGPMGGIWFWTIFGVGLAADRIYKQWPRVLDDLESDTRSAEVKSMTH